jgi:hypothetical protein
LSQGFDHPVRGGFDVGKAKRGEHEKGYDENGENAEYPDCFGHDSVTN